MVYYIIISYIYLLRSKFAPRCAVCLHSIKPENGSEETVRIVALDRNFHVDCYRCEVSISINIIYTYFFK